MTRYHCGNRRLKEVAAMKQKAYRQNPTVIDLSKKARPPPGETTLIYMNCLIIWILLTMPMRPSGLFGRAHFVRSKNFWRNFKKSSAFLKNAVLPREKGGSTTNFPTRKEVRMWNLIAGSFTNSVLFRSSNPFKSHFIRLMQAVRLTCGTYAEPYLYGYSGGGVGK